MLRASGRSGLENNSWFNINSPGQAVPCYFPVDRAAKVLARAISTSTTL